MSVTSTQTVLEQQSQSSDTSSSGSDSPGDPRGELNLGLALWTIKSEQSDEPDRDLRREDHRERSPGDDGTNSDGSERSPSESPGPQQRRDYDAIYTQFSGRSPQKQLRTSHFRAWSAEPSRHLQVTVVPADQHIVVRSQPIVPRWSQLRCATSQYGSNSSVTSTAASPDYGPVSDVCSTVEVLSDPGARSPLPSSRGGSRTTTPLPTFRVAHFNDITNSFEPLEEGSEDAYTATGSQPDIPEDEDFERAERTMTLRRQTRAVKAGATTGLGAGSVAGGGLGLGLAIKAMTVGAIAGSSFLGVGAIVGCAVGIVVGVGLIWYGHKQASQVNELDSQRVGVTPGQPSISLPRLNNLETWNPWNDIGSEHSRKHSASDDFFPEIELVSIQHRKTSESASRSVSGSSGQEVVLSDDASTSEDETDTETDRDTSPSDAPTN